MLSFVLKVSSDDSFGHKLSRELVLVLANKVNHDRVLHSLEGDALDELRDGCGEDHLLEVVVNLTLDELDVVLEAHVEHSATFVEHDVINGI